jgi:hypothetical protein
MEEWKNYKRLFYRVGGNIWKARIFENNAILEGSSNIGISVLGENRYNLLPRIGKEIRLGDLCENGRIKDKFLVERSLGMGINLAEYFRLRNKVAEIMRIYGNGGEEGLCIDEFMRAKRRGGGVLRRVITGKRSREYMDMDPRRVPAALTLWGEQIVNTERWLVELNYDLWGTSRLDVNFRSFCFNMMQGRLYLNNVLFRIRPQENSSKCTFCCIVAKNELRTRGIGEDRAEYNYYLNLQPIETVSHLFWECDHVQPLIQQIYRWVFGMDWALGNEVIGRDDFFQGNVRSSIEFTKCDIIWKHFVKYQIYMKRLCRKMPTFGDLLHEMMGLREITKKYNWGGYVVGVFGDD